MHMHIPAVLTAKQVADCAGALARAEWVDGRITAGHQSAQVKDNLQLSETDPTARRLGDMILTALGRNPLFMSGALPVKVVPPLFNRYENSQAYGDHIDGAIHLAGGAAHRIRTDLSATLFLTAPEDYDGGELVIRGGLAAERIKLPAGDMILYPAATLHRVEPVTRGRRVCSFFWIQSMVREADRREILFDLDTAIQHLSGRGLTTPEQLSIVTLTGVYHNLLRQWAEV